MRCRPHEYPRMTDVARHRPDSSSAPAPSLDAAREHERAGRLDEADAAYRAAIADRTGLDPTVLADVLRRLGAVARRRRDFATAGQCCGESLAVATQCGDPLASAEALNGLALIEIEQGRFDPARTLLARAVALGAEAPALVGRLEQNFGVIDNITGDLASALSHYERSLAAFTAAGDDRGQAIAFHNLGMIHADRGHWEQAERSYSRSLELAEQVGDVHLRGLALLNRTEVLLALQRLDAARAGADAALGIFTALGAASGQSAAHKFLGVLLRETGHPAAAEEQFQMALAIAVDAADALCEAEAARELALLHGALGRNREALEQLHRSHRLFERLQAQVDLLGVSRKRQELESIFLAVVRSWGASIESADTYTAGHCSRVADYSERVAGLLGLDDAERTTIRIGAFLHDLGKVRVPLEILNKPGKLTPEEFSVMQRHPEWGLELLGDVDLPWDVRPIIRSHHEKRDGSGYPDALRGDSVPRNAQVIGIVDMYDALTTTRSYRPAMTHEKAMGIIDECKAWWREDVVAAFRDAVGGAGRGAVGAQ